MLYQATPVCTVMNDGDRAARPALQAGPPTSSSRGALAVCGSRDIVRDPNRLGRSHDHLALSLHFTQSR